MCAWRQWQFIMSTSWLCLHFLWPKKCHISSGAFKSALNCVCHLWRERLEGLNCWKTSGRQGEGGVGWKGMIMRGGGGGGGGEMPTMNHRGGGGSRDTICQSKLTWHHLLMDFLFYEKILQQLSLSLDLLLQFSLPLHPFLRWKRRERIRRVQFSLLVLLWSEKIIRQYFQLSVCGTLRSRACRWCWCVSCQINNSWRGWS